LSKPYGVKVCLWQDALVFLEASTLNLFRIFKRRELWSIGVYKLNAFQDIFELGSRQPVSLIGEVGFRKDFQYQSTVADPFLFVSGETLYLFYEVKTDFGHGEIWVKTLLKDGSWGTLGRALKEDFHLSYPQVFEHQGNIYMLPEAAASGKVLLYVAVEFPLKWKMVSVVVEEPLVDPTLIIQDNDEIFLLATTRKNELKLYFASNLKTSFIDSGIVITKDLAISRCGGAPLRIGKVLYRIAQDCTREYGKFIRLLRIHGLSRTSYSEEIFRTMLFSSEAKWMRNGYHHLSAVEFEGAVYMAVDGRRKDMYVNTLILGAQKMFKYICAAVSRD
jgi:hypothetical protein